MQTPAEVLTKMLNAYQQAVWRKDMDAFVSLYADDIHVFDMWSAWSLSGIAAWREMAKNWFSALGEERVRVDLAEVSASGSGDLVIGHAFLTFAAISAEGKELRSLNNRLTVALRRDDDGVWKVFHEHTSAPIDHQSTKAILRR